MTQPAPLPAAAPFWIAYLLIPTVVLAATQGGWMVFLPPLCTLTLFGLLDAVIGTTKANPDPTADPKRLFWHRLPTLLWAPAQLALMVWLLWYVPQATHLTWAETLMVAIGLGVLTGTIGITYSHELMHQKPSHERRLSEALLAMVLYSRFRSEHLLVHHPHVGTPRDTVTARYNENFHRYYRRVMRHGFASAFRAETAMLARKGLAWHHRSNPFWRYWATQALMLALALGLGGWLGLAIFLIQAVVAIWVLELVNYVEHYGLTRKHLGSGKYEHVQPRHSWNADHRATNWLLINLQRHSDHHYKPDRRYPLLQTYAETEAPLLPYSYAVMTLIAMSPRHWRRMMNPRVQAWRARYYPEITDWKPYNKATTQLPA
jgi:alkane 1-monooxygenase